MRTTAKTRLVGEAQKQAAIDQHSRQAREFAGKYRAIHDRAPEDCFAYSRRRLDTGLDRWLPRDGRGLRLLDVGCGPGHHMARFRARGFEVAGVDASDAMLHQARAVNADSEIFKSDVNRLPFSDAKFDYVISIEVIRYLPDPLPMMREVARVLKPRGVCMVTAAPRFSLNGYWLVNRAARITKARSLVWLKQYFTTTRELRSLCDHAGFDRCSVESVYYGPINWVERLSHEALPGLLHKWEPIDRALTARQIFKDFSNMYLVCAAKRQA